MDVYIVLKDWIDFSICNKHRIINEFTVNNSTLDKEIQNSKRLFPKKVDINREQNKLTLYV